MRHIVGCPMRSAWTRLTVGMEVSLVAPPGMGVPPASRGSVASSSGTGPGAEAVRQHGFWVRATGLSFFLGLLSLRLCWFPGVNCVLALAALVLGLIGLFRILRHREDPSRLDEAATGIVMGAIVLALSALFVAAFLVALWQ